MADLLTLEEAAAYLRLTPRAIYSQRADLREPGSLGFLVTGRVMFRRSDLDDFIERRRLAHVARLEGRRERLEASA